MKQVSHCSDCWWSSHLPLQASTPPTQYLHLEHRPSLNTYNYVSNGLYKKYKNIYISTSNISLAYVLPKQREHSVHWSHSSQSAKQVSLQKEQEMSGLEMIGLMGMEMSCLEGRGLGTG